MLLSNYFVCSITSLKKWTQYRTPPDDYFWINKKSISQLPRKFAKLDPILSQKSCPLFVLENNANLILFVELTGLKLSSYIFKQLDIRN